VVENPFRIVMIFVIVSSSFCAAALAYSSIVSEITVFEIIMVNFMIAVEKKLNGVSLKRPRSLQLYVK